MQEAPATSTTHIAKDQAGWKAIPDRETIEQAMAALNQRNVRAQFATDKKDALARLIGLIPTGAEVMTGSSMTLEQIGFLDMLKSGEHRWKNLKDAILAEKDPAKQLDLRMKGTLSEYFVGSVQAVTQAGEVVIASASGSQISAYAYSAKNVIWIVGAQKIVPTLDEALWRVREYVLPLEDQRMKDAGLPGSFLGKILIFEREASQRKRNIDLIFVGQSLGF